MFDYLVEDNDLKPVMEEYGLVLPKDLVFIKEQMGGPQVSNGCPSSGVCTLTLPTQGYAGFPTENVLVKVVRFAISNNWAAKQHCQNNNWNTNSHRIYAILTLTSSFFMTT